MTFHDVENDPKLSLAHLESFSQFELKTLELS